MGNIIPKSYCENCGKPIYTWSKRGKGIVKKYCSNECYKDARGRRIFAYTICNYCGKTFKESRDRPNIYCSTKCSGLANASNNFMQEFEAFERQNEEHRNELYNSYKELLEKAQKIRYQLQHEKICVYCGQYFFAKSLSQKFCSEECSKRYTNRNKDKRIYKNGKPDNSITLTKLYMRDGGVCQICGKKIDFDCEPNSNHYPSIDHIKPIAKGGLHIWDNVQLACRICNSVKSDRWE